MTDGAVYNVPELVQLVRKQKKHKVYNMMIMSVIDVRQRKIRYIEKTDRVVFSVMKVNIIISTCPS